MGNHISCLLMSHNKETIQLIRSDGTHQILQKPISAAQIMQEFPQHLICHSDSFYIGQKTPALSPNEELEEGNKYFLLPQHFFHSPLSLLSLASSTSPPPQNSPPINSSLHLSAQLRNIDRASALCQPLVIETSNVGGGPRIRVSSEFITKLMEDGRSNVDERRHAVGGNSADNYERRLCNTPNLQKDYAHLVKPSGQRWTPKLETIKEC